MAGFQGSQLIWKTHLPALLFHNVSLIEYLTKYMENLSDKEFQQLCEWWKQETSLSELGTM